jgi:hypothetical protein
VPNCFSTNGEGVKNQVDHDHFVLGAFASILPGIPLPAEFGWTVQ